MDRAATSLPSSAPSTASSSPKRLNVFERYLSLWVGLCIVVGVVLGLTAPGMMQALRSLEFGAGSQINVPIAILIWLMITPMMMKVDFGSIRSVGRRPRGRFVTLFVNWLVKPFSMAAIAWLFFRYVFSPWISPADADQYIAGSIILAAAPCTAMVLVRSYLTDGDPAYTLVQVSVNDLLMLVLFAPIVTFLVSGASSLDVPFQVLLYSVLGFIVAAPGALIGANNFSELAVATAIALGDSAWGQCRPLREAHHGQRLFPRARLCGAPCRVQPDLAHGLAGAGDLSPHHRREPRGQAPSDEDHVTASAGGHP
jgi:ACR3 family arsenite efflux pump ArsB